MKKLVSVLLATVSLVVAGGCGPTPGTPSPAPAALPARPTAADSASAHGAAAGFLAAFDSLQWERFRGYFADDVTMFFPFPQVPARADGRAAVEDVFGRFMEAQRAARTRAGRPLVQGITPRDLRVQMVGSDAAVVTFHLGAGAPSRRSLVFHRSADGSWKVVHWHASPPPQAPAR